MNTRYDLQTMLEELDEDIAGFDRTKKLSQDDIQRRIQAKRAKPQPHANNTQLRVDSPFTHDQESP